MQHNKLAAIQEMQNRGMQLSPRQAEILAEARERGLEEATTPQPKPSFGEIEKGIADRLPGPLFPDPAQKPGFIERAAPSTAAEQIVARSMKGARAGAGLIAGGASGLAEFGRQAFTPGEDLDAQRVLEATLAPIIGRGVGVAAVGGAKFVAKYTPGVDQLVRTKFIEGIGSFMDDLLPPGMNISKLFQDATRAGGKIPLARLQRTITEISRKLATTPGARAPVTRRFIREITTKWTKARPAHTVDTGILGAQGQAVTRQVPATGRSTVSLSRADAELSTLGREIGKLAHAGGGQDLSMLKQLMKGLYDSLDDAVSSNLLSATAKAQLRIARDTFKRKMSVGTLDGIMESNLKHVAGQGDLVDFRPNMILDKLNLLTNPRSKLYDKNFVTGLGDELPKIKAFFVAANNIGPMKFSPGAGNLIVRSALASLVGLPILAVTGSPSLGVLGGVVGVKIPEIIARMITTTRGRDLLLGFLKTNNGLLDRNALAVIAQFVNTGQQELRR